ncbi:MAG TPA: LppX_LprAFG lipoprotein [Chloroflexi bacterium]|nr:LppX_LprAFG lipoprotein [Chloroflexota bacterium]
MKRLIPFILILSLIAILAIGCNVEPEEVITPAMILADGVTHMAGLPGFEFSITQEGQIVFLDADEVVQFGSAVGHYVSPDKALTTVTITALGMLTEITVISLPDIQWASNPLSGVFQELPDTYLFKPTQYLDPTSGFFPSLGSGLADLVVVGEEELEEMPGLPLTHLSGTVPGEVISEISKGLINIESMSGDLWMDTATNEVHRVVLTDTSAAEGEASIWTFDFWSFGETIEITAP